MHVAALVLALRHMEIGDLVTYEGCVYVLRGLDPMSVPDRHAQLEDPADGAYISAPLAEVSPRDP
jgi:hypothetical protein